MVIIRAVPPLSISAIGRRRRAVESPRRPLPARAEPRPRAAEPAPAQRRVEMMREPVAETVRLSVARMKAALASASPARTAHDRSLEKVTCSYFGPVRKDCHRCPGQSDGASVISPKPSYQTPNCGIEIEDRAADADIRYHAMPSEKRRNRPRSNGSKRF